MFHSSDKPYSNKELSNIFFDIGIDADTLVINLIKQYSQLNQNKIKIIERKNNKYHFVNFYSSILIEEIQKHFEEFLSNMTENEYIHLYKNGYLRYLAKYDFIPDKILDEYYQPDDFYPGLALDLEFKISSYTKCAYSYLKVAQYRNDFIFEMK